MFMKRRGLSRKGQEVLSGSSVGWIIAIIVLVVVILAIMYVRSKAQTVAGNIPENAAAVATACSLNANSDDVNSYCLQFKKLSSDTYATCDRAEEFNVIITDSDDSKTLINAMNEKCKQYETNLKSKILEACTTGDYKGKTSVKINGKSCSEYASAVKCVPKATTSYNACNTFKTSSSCPTSYCTWDETKKTCSAKSGLAACDSLTDMTQCANRGDCTTQTS